MGSLELQMLMPLLILAAFTGDNTNYWIGRYIGNRLDNGFSLRFIKHEHLEKTHNFFDKHGGKTIIFARFLPIIRTFAPFVAGIGVMRYRTFLMFSALGSLAWISFFTVLGYYFGNIPVIKNNLILLVLGIIIVSFMPAIREYIKHRRQRTQAK
jgi:membrane-associated protein